MQISLVSSFFNPSDSSHIQLQLIFDILEALEYSPLSGIGLLGEEAFQDMNYAVSGPQEFGKTKWSLGLALPPGLKMYFPSSVDNRAAASDESMVTGNYRPFGITLEKRDILREIRRRRSRNPIDDDSSVASSSGNLLFESIVMHPDQTSEQISFL